MSRMPSPVSMKRALVAAFLTACATWSSGSAQAQGVPGGGGGGVSIDTDGVVRFRTTGAIDKKLPANRVGKRSAKGEKSNESLAPRTTYISLPGVFARVREVLDKNEEIPVEMRYLDGLVRLEYVFVDQEGKDLVIAGDSEPFDATGTDRPVGKRTGRPVYRLDDLVVALRTVGPGRRNGTFGCSIDLTNDAIERTAAVAREIGSVARGRYDGLSERFADAAGMQPIRFVALEPDTHFAFVCVEADYLMKQLALGIMKSPVKEVKSRVAMMKKDEPPINRWWFVPRYDPILVAEDGGGYALRGPRLEIKASGSITIDSVPASPSGEKFAELFSEHIEELSEKVVAFADLGNLADLGVVAALIRADGLDRKADWDMAWVMDEKGYPVPRRVVPKEAETVANLKTASGTVLIAFGGVTLNMNRVVDQGNRKIDSEKSIAYVARKIKKGAWSVRVEK